MSAKRDLQNVMRMYGQAAVDDALIGMGYGGSRYADQNVGRTQERTPYKGKEYIQDMSEAERARYLEDRQFATEDKFQNERIKQARVQTDFTNRSALDDQANRAQAALEVLRGYNQAREANQRFITQLNQNPL